MNPWIEADTETAPTTGRPFRVVQIGLVGSRWMSPRLLHAYVEKAGFDVKTIFFREDFEFLDPPDEAEFELLIGLLDELKPDLVGLGFVSYFLRDAKEITRRIKERFDVPVVWGGVHASLKPAESLEHADMACVGEGEEALVELATRLRDGDGRTDIPNIWFRTPDGRVVENPSRPLMRDLDALPWADYTDENKFFIVGHEIHRDHNPTAYQKYEYDTLTARGCPYVCSFCINHISFGDGARLRRRSVDDVIGELLWAKENMPGLRKVHFWDDVFTYDRKWLAAFAPVYKEKIGLPFFCYVHPQMIARPQAELLAEMGCSNVTMGIQHGSERVRKELYDRHETNEQIIEAVQGMVDNGLDVKVDMIASVLTENEEDLRANMDLLLKLPKPFTPSLHGMNYFPGYKLTGLALAEGAIRPEEVVGESSRRKIKVSDEEIDRDPWLCYISMAGKTYVPNAIIKAMIALKMHERFPRLLTHGTRIVLKGGRGLAGVRHIVPLLRRDRRSLLELTKFVRANFTNR